MELTAEQRHVVEHGTGPLRISGRAGTGKTTALVARYLRLAKETAPSRILFLCRSREAVNHVREAVLPELAGGFDGLPIATFGAMAFDVLARTGDWPRRISSAAQRALVRDLLASDDPDDWPSLRHLLGRAAFADEVLDGILRWRTEATATARTTELDDAWRELAAFGERYAHALDSRGVTDYPGFLARALASVREAPVTYDHVLVDDFEAATPATDRFLQELSSGAASVCVAANPDAAIDSREGAGPRFFAAWAGPLIELTDPFRRPAPVLIRCNHPSVEPEVVAGELLAARDAGVRWSDMAVLVRRPRQRARAITRALARHGIPVAAADAPLDDEPVVTAAVDMVRWAAGDEAAYARLLASPLSGLDPVEVRRLRRALADPDPDAAAGITGDPRLAELVALRVELEERLATHDPAALVFHVWVRALGPVLVGSNDPADDRAIDAFVAFHDGLTRLVERNPSLRAAEWLGSLDGTGDRWRAARPTTDAVLVASATSAAGREWHTVVVAGAVEGEFPSVHGREPVFDPAVLEGGQRPTAAVRRRQSLAAERRLFCEVACTRATATLVATAAPEPGVLEGRFVGDWPTKAAAIPLAPGRPPVVRPPTDGSERLFPDDVLPPLSASQLETYEDCPLRYFYEYVLRVRADSNVYAELGTLVHAVLAAFLDPADDDVDYSRPGLRELGERMWRDDLARYRPQVEEARRDYFDMLDRWWDEEGTVSRPDVLAVERRFEVDVGPHRITGSIDRIDRRNGGLRIVDYKTGSRETSAEEMPDNLQLAVYHLAACRDAELAACGPATNLDLMFLRSMKVRSQPVTPDHEAATEARVLAVADSILAEEFEPSVHANCRVCAFHRLCPIQAAGRETAPDA